MNDYLAWYLNFTSATNLPKAATWSTYLDQITEVHLVLGTMEYFFEKLPDGTFSAEPIYDAALYEAITAMIATWEQESDESNSSVIYRRPCEQTTGAARYRQVV